MLNVLEIVLPVFLVIGLGYAIRRQGLVDDNFFVQVNKLVYYDESTKDGTTTITITVNE